MSRWVKWRSHGHCVYGAFWKYPLDRCPQPIQAIALKVLFANLFRPAMHSHIHKCDLENLGMCHDGAWSILSGLTTPSSSCDIFWFPHIFVLKPFQRAFTDVQLLYRTLPAGYTDVGMRTWKFTFSNGSIIPSVRERTDKYYFGYEIWYNLTL